MVVGTAVTVTVLVGSYPPAAARIAREVKTANFAKDIVEVVGEISRC